MFNLHTYVGIFSYVKYPTLLSYSHLLPRQLHVHMHTQHIDRICVCVCVCIAIVYVCNIDTCIDVNIK